MRECFFYSTPFHLGFLRRRKKKEKCWACLHGANLIMSQDVHPQVTYCSVGKQKGVSDTWHGEASSWCLFYYLKWSTDRHYNQHCCHLSWNEDTLLDVIVFAMHSCQKTCWHRKKRGSGVYDSDRSDDLEQVFMSSGPRSPSLGRRASTPNEKQVNFGQDLYVSGL